MAEPEHREISVSWPEKKAIPVTLTSPPKGVAHSGYAVVLGPGAGGNAKTELLTAVATEVAKRGYYCARYEAKVPSLGFRVSLSTRVMEHLFHPTMGAHPVKGCFLGGHSMGTRVAGTVAAQVAGQVSGIANEKDKSGGKGKGKGKGDKDKDMDKDRSTALPTDFVLGLVLFSYPLHTPGDTHQLRDQILLDIPASIPTLMISGLKDTMCLPNLFEPVFDRMQSRPREVIQILEADHGLGFGSSKLAKAKQQALTASLAKRAASFLDESIAAARLPSSLSETLSSKAGKKTEEGEAESETEEASPGTRSKRSRAKAKAAPPTKKQKTDSTDTASIIQDGEGVTKKRAELKKAITDSEWTVALTTVA